MGKNSGQGQLVSLAHGDSARVGPTPRPMVDLEGVRVLVVDDEPDTRQLVARLVGRCGARVTTAGSAERALELLDTVEPDILISDVGMPGRSGYDLIGEIRARGRSGAELPAVALTAFAADENRDRALGAGFQAHVAKPVDVRDLCSVVARLAGRDT